MSDELEPITPKEPVKLAQLSAKVPQPIYDKVAAEANRRGVYNTEIINEAMTRYFAPDKPNEELESLKAELSQAQDALEKITNNYTSLEEKYSDLENQHSGQASILEDATNQIREQAQKIAELESSAKTKSGSVDQIRSELDTAKKERDAYKQKLVELKSVTDITTMTAEQSKNGLLEQINKVGDLAIKSGIIAQSSVLKVAPNYVPRKSR